MKEFKKFISRGNVIDMAVGLIMATYFGVIVKSLVNDIIMPPVGLLLGGVDFSALKIVIKEAQGDAAEVAVNYGAFINTIITFLIVSFAIFMVVKMYNKMQDRLAANEKEAPATPPLLPPKKKYCLQKSVTC